MAKEYTVEELLELAHKHRALHIKVGPLEVQLSPAAFDSGATAIKANEAALLPEAFRKMPTPEEFMFLHAPLVEADEPAPEPS